MIFSQIFTVKAGLLSYESRCRFDEGVRHTGSGFFRASCVGVGVFMSDTHNLSR